MLYVFHGTDVAIAGTKARALVESLRIKRPDAAYEKIDGDTWDSATIESHMGGQGLFSSKYIILLDRVTENVDAKEVLPELVPSLQESPNIFIVLEGKLNAALKKAVEKSAEKTVECEVKASADASAKPSFNVFGLADAVTRKEPLKAWAMYRQAIEQGSEPEAIVGVLFWKAKTVGDLDLARDLIIMYHEAHRGRRDLELATEQCILNCARY